VKKIACLIVASLLIGCGGGGGGGEGGGSSPPPAPLPLSAIVAGRWLGSYTSSVSGMQSVTITLQQVGSSITGTYFSTSGGRGSISGSMSGDTISFTMTDTAPGCIGSFTGTGIVHVPSNGDLTQMFSFKGSTACGGPESGTGTLTGDGGVPPITPTDITGTYTLIEYEDIQMDNYGMYTTSHTADSFSGTMTIGTDNISQSIILQKSISSSGMQYSGTGSYSISGSQILLHNMSYAGRGLVGASDGYIGVYKNGYTMYYTMDNNVYTPHTLPNNVLATYSGTYPGNGSYTESLYFYWVRQ